MVIDEWHGATSAQYATFRYLAGATRFRIEYLEIAGIASLRLGYEYSAQAPPWTADYYNSATVRTQLLFSQREPASAIQLDRNWGTGSPVAGKVPAESWNGRWSGQFAFEGGNYFFRARSDDGVRVYIDQTLVIDAWIEGPVDRSNRFLGVGPGSHLITVDYFKRGGQRLSPGLVDQGQCDAWTWAVAGPKKAHIVRPCRFDVRKGYGPVVWRTHTELGHPPCNRRCHPAYWLIVAAGSMLHLEQSATYSRRSCP